MARLVAKIVIMGLLVVGTYLIVWALPAKPYLVYSSLLDKHALLDKATGPRLIFVGGSGIALGLDSALVEQAVGRPVINMGVNAGFGLRYMLEDAKAAIRAGDIVAVVPEYEHFYGDLLDGDQNLLWALRIQPQSIRYLRPAQILHLLPEVPRFIQLRILEQLRRTPDPIYNRAAFNDHGDFVSHLALAPQTPGLYAVAQTPQINQATIAALVQFAGEIKAKGATMLLIYPTVAQSFWDYGRNEALINQLHAQLTAEQHFVLLGQPNSYLLPTTMFFDTVYHLSSEGRAQRSAQLAQQIGAFIHHQPADIIAQQKN